MDLIVFFIMTFVSGVIVLMGNHYRKLFSDYRESYKRTEILSFWQNISMEWNSTIVQNGNLSYAAVFTGLIVGFLFSNMGGMYGKHYESYFFNSSLWPIILFLVIPYFKDQLFDDISQGTFAGRLLQNDFTFFFSFTVTVMGQMIASYGLYHAISFLWILFNYVICGGLIFFKLYRSEKGDDFSLPSFNKGDKSKSSKEPEELESAAEKDDNQL